MARFCFLLCCISLGATEITLDFLQKQPKGFARDFYILRFLDQQNTTAQEALQAYDLVYKKNAKIEKSMNQKGYVHTLPRDLACKNLSIEELVKQDDQCITYGLKLSSVSSITQAQAQEMIKKLQSSNPLLAKEVEILRSNAILDSILQNKNAQIFGEIFYGLNLKERIKTFNHRIDPQALGTLSQQDAPIFNKMLQYILLSQQFHHFQKSILEAQINTQDAGLLLLLGISHAKNKQPKIAQQYLAQALTYAKYQAQKDKVLFWQYQLTHDQSFLNQLAKSPDANLYSIYANQTLQTKPSYNLISKIDGLTQENINFNISNPFEWQNLKDSLIKIQTKEEFKKTLDQRLAFTMTEPHYAYLLNRIKQYKGNYFLMPYSNALTWENNHQKALTYAIAKQESNFLPALVSSSYALGMMQIMPFNVAPFAKTMGKKNITLDDMFKPHIALEFGRYYLKELEEEFKHPLFVAYAYNGGPGFWRRTLAKKELFVKNRAYEPWLSLELIPYEESKNYGQIVLANYIIYQQLLGKSINVEKFLQQTLIN
ncbi:hypothetical protein BBW65_06365 [Helicobacter enhydrae]|uniref:Transglycosylase SLT domain-containing protein n=1 Tax=Helicobacter enhydrae TaxID=222136 RepID=A0A1B1U6U2_9HELI|nr:lytic transglycosylase domain-containing protein [Helicobacter enhydrae]ANV98441.1 hypothetical protein BBW65_06365 [Helicobacter enhydrae]